MDFGMFVGMMMSKTGHTSSSSVVTAAQCLMDSISDANARFLSAF